MNLRIVFHKVGHGHAVHIFTPANEVIVIDTGCSDDFSPLDWLRKGRDTIDHLVITHPHGDHIQEIEKLSHFKAIRVLSRPEGLSEQFVRDANQGWCKEKLDVYFGLDRRYTAPLTGPAVGAPNGVVVETYYSPGSTTSNINNFSLVVVVAYKGCTVIIPGDNEPSSWKALRANPAFSARLKECHLFLASHHGRESGYCDVTFPELLAPHLCILSDGVKKDTDASDKYSALARKRNENGFPVTFRSGRTDRRFCLMTRTDGFIEAMITPSNGSTLLNITTGVG